MPAKSKIVLTDLYAVTKHTTISQVTKSFTQDAANTTTSCKASRVNFHALVLRSLSRRQPKQTTGDGSPVGVDMQDTEMVNECHNSPESHMLDRPTELCQCIQHGLTRPAVQQHQCPKETYTDDYPVTAVSADDYSYYPLMGFHHCLSVNPHGILKNQCTYDQQT